MKIQNFKTIKHTLKKGGLPQDPSFLNRMPFKQIYNGIYTRETLVVWSEIRDGVRDKCLK